MPRKFRAGKARRDPPSQELLDFFLQRPGGEADSFAVFTWDCLPVSEFRALWHQHAAAIAAEARRRGVAVPDPATYQPHPHGTWVRWGDDD